MTADSMYTRAHHVSSSVRNRGVREDSGHSHFKKKKEHVQSRGVLTV
jgi:hypothetical protein